jgi:small subunit ribosomal protein S17
MTDKADNVSEEKKVRTITGKVVSNKMDKTVAVSVERKVKHPLYGKYMRRSTKYLVHDEDNTCNEGDLVTFAECRPFSKNKSWQLVEVIVRANA